MRSPSSRAGRPGSGRGCAESIVKGWAPRVGPRVCGSIVKGQPTGQRPPGIGVVSGLGAAGTIPELTVLYVLPYVLPYGVTVVNGQNVTVSGGVRRGRSWPWGGGVGLVKSYWPEGASPTNEHAQPSGKAAAGGPSTNSATPPSPASAKPAASAMLLQAKSRHRDLRTLARYAKPGTEAVAALTTHFDNSR